MPPYVLDYLCAYILLSICFASLRINDIFKENFILRMINEKKTLKKNALFYITTIVQ